MVLAIIATVGIQLFAGEIQHDESNEITNTFDDFPNAFISSFMVRLQSYTLI
jgi:hypothetical protein